jgi:hypothetical protein
MKFKLRQLLCFVTLCALILGFLGKPIFYVLSSHDFYRGFFWPLQPLAWTIGLHNNFYNVFDISDNDPHIVLALGIVSGSIVLIVILAVIIVAVIKLVQETFRS